MIYLQLFWEFFKTGLFAVGGGLATLPFLKQIALHYTWFTPDDLLNMIAVAESTPGPIGVNSATYAGFHAAGISGALLATCALALPSVCIMIVISRALTRFRASKLVQNVFYGLRPASAGLILGAMMSVLTSSLLRPTLWTGIAGLITGCNWPAVILFAFFIVVIVRLPKVHPIIWIALGAVLGIALQM